MIVVDVSRDLRTSCMPCGCLKPILESLSGDGDGKHAAQGVIPGNWKSDFSGHSRLPSDSKGGGVSIHAHRHRIEGRVENALLVELLKKSGQGDIIKFPNVVYGVTQGRFGFKRGSCRPRKELLKCFEHLGWGVNPRQAGGDSGREPLAYAREPEP